MIEVLRTVREHWRRLSPYSSKLCLWIAAYISPVMVSYSNFLVLFVHSVRCFL
jgi:hypothetical protein